VDDALARLALLLALAVASGCEAAPSWEYPLDDLLRIDQLRAVGTHNSYHLAPDSDAVEEWNYSHAPLQTQLSAQGVRQFELDVWFDEEARVFEVVHVPLLDDGTTCALLVDCLEELRAWSDAHPAHHPLFVLIEPKDGFDEAVAEARLTELEAEVRATWPPERIVTPADVQGDHSTLREALESDGWPTLGEGRSKLVLQLHDSGELADFYSEGGTRLDHRLMFTGVAPEHPLAAFVAINDPIADADRIADAVDAGIIVRTRADSSRADFEGGDTARRDAALASGAHLLSTDHPIPDAETGYSVTIPGGAPSGCNPRSAPGDCSSTDIEDPDFLVE
jgi:hypothetical protein